MKAHDHMGTDMVMSKLVIKESVESDDHISIGLVWFDLVFSLA